MNFIKALSSFDCVNHADFARCALHRPSSVCAVRGSSVGRGGGQKKHQRPHAYLTGPALMRSQGSFVWHLLRFSFLSFLQMWDTHDGVPRSFLPSAPASSSQHVSLNYQLSAPVSQLRDLVFANLIWFFKRQPMQK